MGFAGCAKVERLGQAFMGFAGCAKVERLGS